MEEAVGWASVGSDTVLSQRSVDSISDHANALHDTTASESEHEYQDTFCREGNQAWWAKAVQEATKEMEGSKRVPTQLRTLLMVSGCTGCFTEGMALKDDGLMAFYGRSCCFHYA